VNGVRTLDRSLPVWVGAALALVFLMALPLGWLVRVSVSQEGGGATLAHYRAVLADPALRRALGNTLVLAFWVGLASIAIGAPLAWLTARTDLPAKSALRALVMASFVTPPFLGAFAWVMLAGPNAGLLNTVWRAWTGASGPLVNIFTMPGLVFVVTIYTFPYVYIMIANTLALIASDLEEAAAIHGAGRITVALTVTLPMVLCVRSRAAGASSTPSLSPPTAATWRGRTPRATSTSGRWRRARSALASHRKRRCGRSPSPRTANA